MGYLKDKSRLTANLGTWQAMVMSVDIRNFISPRISQKMSVNLDLG